MKRKNSGGEDSPSKRIKSSHTDTETIQELDLLSLPVDIHAIIFLKVHTNDAGRSRRVCKYLKEVLENIPDLRWAFLFQSNFGLPERAMPPNGIIWRKQYKYSVSVLKNLVSVNDITRTREVASDITDLEAEQFKFSDLVEMLNKMTESDREKAKEAKSTWAIRVSYYRLTQHLIRHGIFANNSNFFPVTLKQGYQEVLNVLWNEEMYDKADLERYFGLAISRGSDWFNWAKIFIQAGATGYQEIMYALKEDDADLLEKLLKLGVKPHEEAIHAAASKQILKLLLDYGATDNFQETYVPAQSDHQHFMMNTWFVPKQSTKFMSLIERGQYAMAEMLLLSGKAKGVEKGLEIAQQKNAKFAQVILDYLQQ